MDHFKLGFEAQSILYMINMMQRVGDRLTVDWTVKPLTIVGLILLALSNMGVMVWKTSAIITKMDAAFERIEKQDGRLERSDIRVQSLRDALSIENAELIRQREVDIALRQSLDSLDKRLDIIEHRMDRGGVADSRSRGRDGGRGESRIGSTD